MSDMMVLVVEPGRVPYTKSIPSSLASLQQEVGGYIQVFYPWDDPCAIICDEEGKLKNKVLNRTLRDEDEHVYDVIAGTFLIVGLSEENFTSLPEEYIRRYSELFATPELFMRVGNKLLVLSGGDWNG